MRTCMYTAHSAHMSASTHSAHKRMQSHLTTHIVGSHRPLKLSCIPASMHINNQTAKYTRGDSMGGVCLFFVLREAFLSNFLA